MLTVLAIAGLVGFALLSTKVKAFWARVRQGLTIIFDRKRYFREVWLVQLGGWCFRFAAFWFLLDAFHIGGSIKNVLLGPRRQRGRGRACRSRPAARGSSRRSW